MQPDHLEKAGLAPLAPHLAVSVWLTEKLLIDF
jgi:hypothetical protein